MKNIITMILAVILFANVIPAASAQTYEDAANNSVIIEELMYEDFVYDKDSGLWKLESTEEYESCGEQVKYSAEYHLYDNYGTMTVLYYLSDGTEPKEYQLAATYDIKFKWFESEEDFGITSCNIETYQYVNDWLF